MQNYTYIYIYVVLISAFILPSMISAFRASFLHVYTPNKAPPSSPGHELSRSEPNFCQAYSDRSNGDRPTHERCGCTNV